MEEASEHNHNLINRMNTKRKKIKTDNNRLMYVNNIIKSIAFIRLFIFIRN